MFYILPLVFTIAGAGLAAAAWGLGWPLKPSLLMALLPMAAAQVLFFTGAWTGAGRARNATIGLRRMVAGLRAELSALDHQLKRLKGEMAASAMTGRVANDRQAPAAEERPSGKPASASGAANPAPRGRTASPRRAASTSSSSSPAATPPAAGQLSAFRLYMEPVADMAAGRTALYRAVPALAADGERLFLGAQAGLRASRLGVATAFDMKALEETAAFLRRLAARGHDMPVICPLMPASLASATFRDGLEAFLKENAGVAGRLILDISQQTLSMLGEDGMLGLAWLAQHGVPLSLSGAHPGKLEAAALKKLGFHWLDMDARAISASLAADGGTALGKAAQAGLQLIASHVDDQRMVARLKPFLRLARGRAFSPPRRVRLAAPEGKGNDSPPASRPARPAPAGSAPGRKDAA